MQSRNNPVAWAALAVALTTAAAGAGVAVGLHRQVAALGLEPDYVSAPAVRHALLEDPAMLIEAGRKLRANALADRTKADASLVDASRDELAKPTEGFLGNPAGKHLVVEFFDYQCGHCRDSERLLADAVGADPEMRIVLREIPILGPGSDVAARAALASARQGVYRRMHDALMVLPVPITQDAVEAAARAIGADAGKLRVDMASDGIRDALAANVSLSRRVGVTGTPAFAVPGRGLLQGLSAGSDLVAFVDGHGHS